jgi:hypothetical protein
MKEFERSMKHKKETTPIGAESNPRDKYITERKENGN